MLTLALACWSLGQHDIWKEAHEGGVAVIAITATSPPAHRHRQNLLTAHCGVGGHRAVRGSVQAGERGRLRAGGWRPSREHGVAQRQAWPDRRPESESWPEWWDLIVNANAETGLVAS